MAAGRRRVLPWPSRDEAIDNASMEEPEVPTEHLTEEINHHASHATPIVHEEFQGLRITPNIYTTLPELDRFANVMEKIARQGLPA